MKKLNKISPKCRKRINIAIWVCFVVFIISATLIFIAINNGVIGYMPEIDKLENPIDHHSSQVLFDDGTIMDTYSYSHDTHNFVDNYTDLSPNLVNALIATEDIRFPRHSGIDAKGLMRAVVKRGFLMQNSAGGGSTITQQLSKLLYSPSASSVIERLFQKPIEWVIAVRLEKFYTKEEIINMYLNKFDFLYNAVGIDAAAKAYFSTTPKDLTIEEAAVLVGMCKNPSYYNPKKFPERAKGRRNTVLGQMYKYGYIDKAACDSISNLPLEIKYTPIDHKVGPAPYFREYLRSIMMAQKPERKNYPSWQQQKYGKFEEDSVQWEENPLYGWCNKNVKANGKNYNIYTDGLKIHTTINARMQRYAEEVVRSHVGKELQPAFFKEKSRDKKYAPFSFPYTMSEKEKTQTINEILQRSIKQSYRYKTMKDAGASENEIEKAFKTKTGMTVFSWNGDIDTIMSPIDSIRYYKTFLRTAFMAMDVVTGHVKAYVGGIDFANFQYDMVTMGRRQIGSTMKPFLYSLAMTEGFTPCTPVLNVQPHLRDEEGNLWEPRNSTRSRIGETVTVQWGLQNSSNWITGYLMSQLSPYSLERLLRSYGFKGQIDAVVSMCLGTPDISVSEMVSAYTVFTNRGIRVEPMYVTSIEDSYGNTVATFTQKLDEVLSEDATFKMLSMLRSVVNGGTASRLRYKYGLKAEMGGKTGTTQNNSDGWFMGFTPSLVAGCWVGGEDRSIHFSSMAEGQGANMALPIFANFMKKVYADKTLGYSENEKFVVPKEYENPCSTKSRIITFDDEYIDENDNNPESNGIDKYFE